MTLDSPIGINPRIGDDQLPPYCSTISFSKIFEKTLNACLLQYLDKYCLISESQFGFLRGKSTADAVYRALTEIYDRLDNRGYVARPFSDLSKAFDLIDHALLFDKMQAMGIRGDALDFFRSFLAGRKFRVCVTNNTRKKRF